MRDKTKVITIAALVVAIIALSIGFAAFSSTLNITTGASVSPEDGNFIVKFSKLNDALNEQGVAPSLGTGDTAVINNTNASNPVISNLSASFTQPGDVVEYTFYVRNMGKYDAHLTDVRFNKTGGEFKTCTATGDNPVSDTIKNQVCSSIKFTVTLENSPSNISLTSTSDYANDVNVDYIVNKSSTPNSGTTNSKMVKVRIEYPSSAPHADGGLEVTFGNVEMVFATLAGYVPQTPLEPVPNNTNYYYSYVYDAPVTYTISDNCESVAVGFGISESDAEALCNSSVSNIIYTMYQVDETDYRYPYYEYAFAGNGVLEQQSEGNIIGIFIAGMDDVPLELNIPASINNLPVLIVSGLGANTINSVTIPNTVQEIAPGAFVNCNLQSVDFSNATSLTLIGEQAFLRNNLTSVTLPNNLTTISPGAFQYNSISSIVIPDSVTTIGYSAFTHNDLTRVEIGSTSSSLTSIGEDAFDSNDLSTIIIHKPEGSIDLTYTGLDNGPTIQWDD